MTEVAKQVKPGKADNTPVNLNTPGKWALYNNLNQNKALAMQVDEAVKNSRPDGWRGVREREDTALTS